MIILSDGVDFGSRANVDDAIGAGVREDVVIYSILFSDATFYRSMNPAGPYSTDRGEAVLRGMANATGGVCLRVSKDHNLEQMFDHIAEDLLNQYSLGFVSDRRVIKPEVRTLTLRTKQKGLTVQARKWYFVQP